MKTWLAPRRLGGSALQRAQAVRHTGAHLLLRRCPPPSCRHNRIGVVGMASAGPDGNSSQFYITTRDTVDYLDGKHTIFGHVVEGMDVLTAINEAYCDAEGRPYQDIRIKHTYVLVDPFPDPPALQSVVMPFQQRSAAASGGADAAAAPAGSESPEGPPREERVPRRLADDEAVSLVAFGRAADAAPLVARAMRACL